MKLPAHFLGLLLASVSVTALAEDKPVAPAAEAAPPPAATPPAEPKKAESVAVTAPVEPAKADAPAVTPPALSQPAVSQSNPPNGPPAVPVPFTPLANGKVDDKTTDADVLELPKMVVKQKPRPRLTPEIMVTKKAFGEDLAKQKFTTLDQVLNKFTLPLFGTSLAERALEDHDREKKEELNKDVSNIAKDLETTDPEAAKSLRDAAARP
jgi:hypothetical protein